MRTKHWIVIGATVFTAGCQTDPVREGEILCKEPRPEICTREYVPVCAVLADSTTKTYANGCEACADKQVVSHLPGACE